MRHGSRMAAGDVSARAHVARPQDAALCRPLRPSAAQRGLLRHPPARPARRLGLRSRDRRMRRSDRPHPSLRPGSPAALFEEAARQARLDRPAPTAVEPSMRRQTTATRSPASSPAARRWRARSPSAICRAAVYVIRPVLICCSTPTLPTSRPARLARHGGACPRRRPASRPAAFIAPTCWTTARQSAAGQEDAGPGRRRIGPALMRSATMVISASPKASKPRSPHRRFSAIPTWAALSADGLRRWQWPEGINARHHLRRRRRCRRTGGRSVSPNGSALAGIASTIVSPLHGDDFNDDLRHGATPTTTAAPQPRRPAPAPATVGDFETPSAH